jgi:hypothetical protein
MAGRRAMRMRAASDSRGAAGTSMVEKGSGGVAGGGVAEGGSGRAPGGGASGTPA